MRKFMILSELAAALSLRLIVSANSMRDARRQAKAWIDVRRQAHLRLTGQVLPRQFSVVEIYDRWADVPTSWRSSAWSFMKDLAARVGIKRVDVQQAAAGPASPSNA